MTTWQRTRTVFTTIFAAFGLAVAMAGLMFTAWPAVVYGIGILVCCGMILW